MDFGSELMFAFSGASGKTTRPQERNMR